MTRLLLLADTHVPKRARDLPPQVWAEVDAADLVVHAGDWVEPSLLDALEARSRRLLACYGNNDGNNDGAERRPTPTTTYWSSGTATSRGTPPPRRGCGCSTRGHRPTDAGSPAAPT